MSKAKIEFGVDLATGEDKSVIALRYGEDIEIIEEGLILDFITENMAEINQLRKAIAEIMEFTKGKPIGSDLYKIHMASYRALYEPETEGN